MVNCINLIIEMSPRSILGRENVPCVAEVVNRSLKADCTDYTIQITPYQQDSVAIHNKTSTDSLNPGFNKITHQKSMNDSCNKSFSFPLNH